MTTIEQIMKLADAHADASFTQGLEQITADPRPEKAREKLKAAITELDSEKADLQKRLDAAITALADQKDVSSRAHEAWLKAMSKIGDLEAELDALKKQDHVGIVVNDFEVGLCADVPLGAKVYLAAGAQPAIAVTKEQVRAAGGIVHSDGNVFFTNLEQLNSLLNAGAQP